MWKVPLNDRRTLCLFSSSVRHVPAITERQSTLFIQFQHFVHSIPALCSFSSRTLFIQFQHFVHWIPALCSFNSSTFFIKFQHFVHWIPALSSLNSSTVFIQFQHFVHSIPPLVHSIPALCSLNPSTLFIPFQPSTPSCCRRSHWTTGWGRPACPTTWSTSRSRSPACWRTRSTAPCLTLPSPITRRTASRCDATSSAPRSSWRCTSSAIRSIWRTSWRTVSA